MLGKVSGDDMAPVPQELHCIASTCQHFQKIPDLKVVRTFKERVSTCTSVDKGLFEDVLKSYSEIYWMDAEFVKAAGDEDRLASFEELKSCAKTVSERFVAENKLMMEAMASTYNKFKPVGEKIQNWTVQGDEWPFNDDPGVEHI